MVGRVGFLVVWMRYYLGERAEAPKEWPWRIVAGDLVLIAILLLFATWRAVFPWVAILMALLLTARVLRVTTRVTLQDMVKQEPEVVDAAYAELLFFGVPTRTVFRGDHIRTRLGNRRGQS